MSKYSASALGTSFDCSQLYDYTYNKKLQPADDSSFEANYGRAFHALREGDTELLGTMFGDHWAQIISIHYEAYKTRWSDKHEKYWRLKDLAHEVRFEFELAPGYTFHGIVDGVVELEGVRYLLETKTTGQQLDAFYKYKEHSIQAGLYQLAMKHAPELVHYNAQGIIYDVTRRASIRQRGSESPEGYRTRVAQWFPDNRKTAFGRMLIQRSEQYMDDFAANVMTQADIISTGLFAKNPNTCYKYRPRKCGFFPACFEQEPLTNTDLYQPRKRR